MHPTRLMADKLLGFYMLVKLDLSWEAAVIYVLNGEPFSRWREQSVPPLFSPTATIDINLTLEY